MMHSTKIAQMVLLRQTKGPPQLKIRNPVPLVQIQNDFTELLLMMHTTKFAQMVLLYWTKGPPEF